MRKTDDVDGQPIVTFAFPSRTDASVVAVCGDVNDWRDDDRVLVATRDELESALWPTRRCGLRGPIGGKSWRTTLPATTRRRTRTATRTLWCTPSRRSPWDNTGTPKATLPTVA